LQDTPFHVAARSRNQDAIIFLLNTFAPTNNRWDVDDVDTGRQLDTVINICARHGNARAVALLIKHGADISKGVLHEIVLESVRNPHKTDRLLAVYQSIVDNAVTWHCLEHGFLAFRSSDDYAVYFRKIGVWLLTNPLDRYGEKDVLQCALDHGASAMFWRIINTKSVFRYDGDEARRLTADDDDRDDGRDVDSQNYGKQRNWTVFDVTNFTRRTFVKAGGKEEKSPLLSAYQQTAGGTDDANDVGNPSVLVRNLDVPATPREPYLAGLLTAFDQWRSSNILKTEPIRELTQPYIRLAQRFRFVLGLVQLAFMFTFTGLYMPTSCSLAAMFNRSSALCNSSENAQLPFTIGHRRSLLAVLWLIWPLVLFAMNAYTTWQHAKNVSSVQNAEKLVFRSKELGRLRSCFLTRTKFAEAFLRHALSTIFCVTMFVWLFIYFVGQTYESYIEVTGMVLLFGWIANLDFFGAVMMSFSIFLMVVLKIIVKDIPSFMLYFGFTVVGYSFAMHALRMLACTPNEFVDETFFSVLSSAFGIGDFFEVTMTDSACAGAAMHYLLELVYLFYICATMIILLNVLIAMLNHRYERAIPKAENIWRFHILSVMSALERHEVLKRVMKKCGILNVSVDDADDDGDNSCTCSRSTKSDDNNSSNIVYVYDYGDKNSGSLFYNKKLRRYYLRLVLPVDEQLKKP